VTYSPRTLILGPNDTLYRLASAKFSRMVDDPESHRLERFAGQRVRMAEAIVERLESSAVSATWYGHDYFRSFVRAHREQQVSARSCLW